MSVPAQYIFYAKQLPRPLEVREDDHSSDLDGWCDFNPFVEETPHQGKDSSKREIPAEKSPLKPLPAHLFEENSTPAFIEDDAVSVQSQNTFSLKKVGYIAFFALAAAFWFVHSTGFFAQKETPPEVTLSSFWRFWR